MAHALKTFYCSRALCTWVNLDTIGCLWTGEFDLEYATCGRENFWIRKEKVAGSKISECGYACGTGETLPVIPACIAIPVERSKARLSRHVTTHQFSSRDVDVENQHVCPWAAFERDINCFVLPFCWHFTVRQQAGRRNVPTSEELDFWRAVETEKGSFARAIEVSLNL